MTKCMVNVFPWSLLDWFLFTFTPWYLRGKTVRRFTGSDGSIVIHLSHHMMAPCGHQTIEDWCNCDTFSGKLNFSTYVRYFTVYDSNVDSTPTQQVCHIVSIRLCLYAKYWDENSRYCIKRHQSRMKRMPLLRISPELNIWTFLCSKRKYSSVRFMGCRHAGISWQRQT